MTERTEIDGGARLTRQRIEAKVTMLRDATRITVDLATAVWGLYDTRAASPY